MQPHYRDPLPLGEPDGLPYSKGVMARALVAAGVGASSSPTCSRRRLELDLAERGARAVELERLEEIAAEVLGEADGARVVVARCAGMRALRALDVPIVLLVGGATGTGKSTVATEAAHRLGITRVTSTDFIRQTIRAFFTAPSMPAVHVSSFEAGGARRRPRGGLPRADARGARRRRGVDRARARPKAGRWRSRASTSCPGWCRPRSTGALLVHAVLRVDSVEATGRISSCATPRPAAMRALDKYLDQLDEIRRLQDIDRRAGRALRRAGDRELEPRAGDRGAARPRARSSERSTAG